MKITSIVENTSQCGLPVEHGLSLYIERDNGQRVLFDMGQSRLFIENANRLALPISDVDVAVISHGHYDHGGGLGHFLQENGQAKVYIHERAFEPHYSLRENGLRFIGLQPESADLGQFVFCKERTKVEEEMLLFADVNEMSESPKGNRLLFGPDMRAHDDFHHEQNLIIHEGGKSILFAGCAHRGILNIIRKCVEIDGCQPSYVFAGMHLVKSGMDETEEDQYIRSLAHQLMQFTQTKFFTMHCTGVEQYDKLKAIMGDQIDYLSCGESMEI